MSLARYAAGVTLAASFALTFVTVYYALAAAHAMESTS